MAETDPLLKIKAKNKLSDIELQADLAGVSKDFNALMILKAPELKQIVSPEELKALIDAVKAGTASNNQLTKFIGLADKVLAKI
jgi:hypothetical protein